MSQQLKFSFLSSSYTILDFIFLNFFLKNFSKASKAVFYNMLYGERGEKYRRCKKRRRNEYITLKRKKHTNIIIIIKIFFLMHTYRINDFWEEENFIKHVNCALSPYADVKGIICVYTTRNVISGCDYYFEVGGGKKLLNHRQKITSKAKWNDAY